MLKEAGGEEVLGSACNCVYVKVTLVSSVYIVHCTVTMHSNTYNSESTVLSVLYIL
jgi:hypothetical protein